MNWPGYPSNGYPGIRAGVAEYYPVQKDLVPRGQRVYVAAANPVVPVETAVEVISARLGVRAVRRVDRVTVDGGRRHRDLDDSAQLSYRSPGELESAGERAVLGWKVTFATTLVHVPVHSPFPGVAGDNATDDAGHMRVPNAP